MIESERYIISSKIVDNTNNHNDFPIIPCWWLDPEQENNDFLQHQNNILMNKEKHLTLENQLNQLNIAKSTDTTWKQSFLGEMSHFSSFLSTNRIYYVAGRVGELSGLRSNTLLENSWDMRY